MNQGLAGLMVIFTFFWNVDIIAQNVGIGTSNPHEKLEVFNPSRSTVKIRSNTFGDTTSLIFSNRYPSETGTDFILSSNQEIGLNFSSRSDLPNFNSDNIIHLNPEGRVGIGTATPAAKLSIIPESSAPDILEVKDAALVQALLVKGNRNVGINTNTPIEKLDVNGKIKLGDDATTSEAGTIRWNTESSDFEGFNGTEWLSLTRSNNNDWPGSGSSSGSGQISDFTQATSNDGAVNDYFGISVSISGNYAIVGAHWDNIDANADQGSAYIFFKTGTNWEQQIKLTASDGAAFDNFGSYVSISGDYAIVGSPNDDGSFTNQGSAYIFLRSGTTWTQQAKIIASDGALNDGFGVGVSISGDYVIVSAPSDDVTFSNQGSAYIFLRSGTSWTQQSKLVASDGALDDLLGISVAISGDYAVAGVGYDDILLNGNQGSAYIFLRSGTTWTQQTKLTGNTGNAYDYFGIAVSISQNYAVVGANGFDWANTDQGAAFVFFRSGSTWTQQAILLAPNGSEQSAFGSSVSLSDEYILVGAPEQESALDCTTPPVNTGLCFIYKKQNSIWTLYSEIKDPVGDPVESFGTSVSIDGLHFLAGAIFSDPNGIENQGKVVFGKAD